MMPKMDPGRDRGCGGEGTSGFEKNLATFDSQQLATLDTLAAVSEALWKRESTYTQLTLLEIKQ